MTPAERQVRYRAKRQANIEAMPKILCACGCEQMIAPINKQGKRAIYKHGHNPDGIATRFPKGQKSWNAGTAKPKPPMEIRGTVKRPIGWYEHIVAANRRRDVKGSNNPFYGRHHSEETKRILSEKNSGANNAGWSGGIATLPYGIGFTRKFKRLIRGRDGNKCQRCSKTRKQNWRALEVHHIDHDKMNNNPTNLITVCPSCNVWLSYHREESIVYFPKRRML